MIYNQLAKSTASVANRTAIVDKKRILKYAQLLSEVDKTARSLCEKGVQPGETIAIQIPNSIEFVISFYSAVKIGANILLLDASLKPTEIENYLKQTQSTFLLYPSLKKDKKDDVLNFTYPISLICVPESNIEYKKYFIQNDSLKNNQKTPVFYLLSSGSTGIPKIIIRNSHQTLSGINIFQNTLPYTETDKVLAMLPFTHSFGFLNVFLNTLSCGASLYIESFSPRSTTKNIKQQEITVLPATPFIFRMLNQTEFQNKPDFSSLRIAISAGSSLPPSISNTFRQKFSVNIFQSYGTTETGPAALACFKDNLNKTGWVGKPYKGVIVDVLDIEGNHLPSGSKGLLAVKSPANTSGYLNHPDANAEIFKKDFILTGDVGLQDDMGNIFILGRERPMINVAGKKVSPAEVETCLRSHENVADVLVFGVKQPDGNETVKAIVVPSGDITALELREFCATKMADFKAPRSVDFVKNLSQGPMGKLKYTTSRNEA